MRPEEQMKRRRRESETKRREVRVWTEENERLRQQMVLLMSVKQVK